LQGEQLPPHLLHLCHKRTLRVGHALREHALGTTVRRLSAQPSSSSCCGPSRSQATLSVTPSTVCAGSDGARAAPHEEGAHLPRVLLDANRAQHEQLVFELAHRDERRLMRTSPDARPLSRAFPDPAHLYTCAPHRGRRALVDKRVRVVGLAVDTRGLQLRERPLERLLALAARLERLVLPARLAELRARERQGVLKGAHGVARVCRVLVRAGRVELAHHSECLQLHLARGERLLAPDELSLAGGRGESESRLARLRRIDGRARLGQFGAQLVALARESVRAQKVGHPRAIRRGLELAGRRVDNSLEPALQDLHQPPVGVQGPLARQVGKRLEAGAGELKRRWSLLAAERGAKD
jgi:hypothetical protein